jgi:hypothetical protein
MRINLVNITRSGETGSDSIILCHATNQIVKTRRMQKSQFEGPFSAPCRTDRSWAVQGVFRSTC